MRHGHITLDDPPPDMQQHHRRKAKELSGGGEVMAATTLFAGDVHGQFSNDNQHLILFITSGLKRDSGIYDFHMAGANLCISKCGLVWYWYWYGGCAPLSRASMGGRDMIY